MNTSILFLLSLIIALWFVFKIISFSIYLKFKRKLCDADFATFTTVLDDNYVFRFLDEGNRRYKWSKGLLTVKATFNNNDKLIYKEILPFHFFKLKIEVIFI